MAIQVFLNQQMTVIIFPVHIKHVFVIMLPRELLANTISKYVLQCVLKDDENEQVVNKDEVTGLENLSAARRPITRLYTGLAGDELLQTCASVCFHVTTAVNECV